MNINHWTINAEIDAFLKLKNQKTIKKINVMIFRTNSDNKNILLSKYCNNCLYSMKLIFEKKNIKLLIFIIQMNLEKLQLILK